MTSRMGEQLTLQDLDIASTKMFPARSQATVAKTSAASSKRRQGSSKAMFAFLDMRANGPTVEASSWNTEASLGNSQMLNITEHRRGDGASVYSLTTTDLLHHGFCLTLNLNEQPRTENPSLLSEILEEDADPRYNLSSKACRGILNRANRRGKKLPEILEEALKAQVTDEEYS